MKMDSIDIEIETGTEKSLSHIDSLISKLKSLGSASEKVSNTMQKVSSSITPVTTKMNEASKTTNEFKNNMSILDKLKAQPELDITEIVKRKDEAKSAINELRQAQQSMLTANKGSFNKSQFADYQEYGRNISKLMSRFKLTPDTSGLKNISNDLRNVNRDLKSTDKQISKAKNSFKNLNLISKGLKGTFSKAFAVFGKIGSVVGKSADTMLHKFKKLGLGLLAIRTVMSLLTKSVAAYLSFDSQLQDSINNSWNMMGALLAPAIQVVANLFATATAYIYNFIKALTGIDLVAKANAKALQNQAKATKAAGQAQRYLSSMDEITNLQDDKSGGGGGDIPQITAPEINSKAMDFIKTLVDKIKAGDWYGAGAYIASEINRALEKTDVKKFTNKIKRGILNATDMFNGFVETLDWSLLGEKFSDLAVGITGAIRAGIENIHWDSLGKGISDFLNNIDWVKLTDNIVSSITGLADGIITVFNNIDFSKLSYNISQAMITGINDITKFLENVDWNKVGQQIGDIILSFDWLGLAVSVIKAFSAGLNVLPKVVAGFVSKIPEKLKNMDWEKVGKDAINLLVEGIKLGLTFAFPLIAPFFDDIVNVAKSAFNGIKNIFTPVIEFFGNIFGTVFSNIKIIFDNIATIIGAVANVIGTLFKPALDGLIKGFKDAWEGIKRAFSPAINFFRNIVNSIKGLFKNFGSSVGSVVGGAFKAVVNAVLRAVENILNFPIRAINGLINTINAIPGVNLKRLNTFHLPRLATGTNNIEKEGIYHLHEGEAVVPKKYNPATGGYDNGADNKQIIDLLIDLNANMLALSEREMAVYMNSRKVAEGIYSDMQTITKNKNVSNNVVRS